MSDRPRLLDLFCGAGGAAMGYHRAGFDVVGVDIKPQPHYPFDIWPPCDALSFLRARVALGAPWEYDAIHASPPCQRYSTATKRNGTQNHHPDLIGEVRELLVATGLPYVIENVVGAPLIEPLVLCGTSLGCILDGYRLRRHRGFETSWEPDVWTIYAAQCTCHEFAEMPVLDVTGGGPTQKQREDGAGGRPYKGTAAQARRIMDINWMTKAELNEAIPPAYTEFIGAQLMTHLRSLVPAGEENER